MNRLSTWLIDSGDSAGMAFSARKLRLATVLALALLWLPGYSVQAQAPSENLVLVTLDGVRWQEVFSGVDPDLIEDVAWFARQEGLEAHARAAEIRRR